MDFIMSVLSTIFKVDEEINNKNRNAYIGNKVAFAEDVVYSDKKSLDIFYNMLVTENIPVVINIHGGGWMVGDKKWRKGIATMYAEQGFFVINPNYSLSPDTLYPECIRDIFKVLDWIADHAKEYHLNLDEVYLTGDSAGGHIAAVVGALQRNGLALKHLGIPAPRCKIAKLALFCGVYDYDKCVSQVGAAGLVKEMTGFDIKEYKSKFEYYKELNPIRYITHDFPPTYMVSAPLDIFCGGQAERLEAQFKRKAVRYVRYIPEDKFATHCFHLDLTRSDSMEAIGGAIRYFLDGSVLMRNRNLLGSGECTSKPCKHSDNSCDNAGDTKDNE